MACSPWLLGRPRALQPARLEWQASPEGPSVMHGPFALCAPFSTCKQRGPLQTMPHALHPVLHTPHSKQPWNSLAHSLHPTPRLHNRRAAHPPPARHPLGHAVLCEQLRELCVQQAQRPRQSRVQNQGLASAALRRHREAPRNAHGGRSYQGGARRGAVSMTGERFSARGAA